VEGNEISRLVWAEGLGDADYIRFWGEGHVFRRNYLHGTRKEEVGKAHVDGWQTYSVNPGEYARDVLIEGNILTGYFAHGVILEAKKEWDGLAFSCEGMTVRNNVFAGGRTVARVVGARDVRISNNTFITVNIVPVGGGIAFMGSVDGAAATGSVKNNIFYDSGWYRIQVFRVDPGCALEGERNLLFIPSSPSFFHEQNLPKDVLNQNPSLVDVANPLGPDGKPFTADDGYLLKPGSPCIDAGVKLDDAVVAKDIFGTTRPQGAGWDIGAQEVAGGVQP